jgi:resuscitation-promoting factor RpfB
MVVSPLRFSVPGRDEVGSDVLALLSGRRGRFAVQAVILTAVVGGTVAYAQHDAVVRLTVDGSTREVHASGDVAAVLASEHIEVGERDLVAPAPGTPVQDGDEIVVQYARRVDLTVDGRTTTYWVTDRTVDEALATIGLRTERARLSASRSTPIGRSGLALSVSTPKTVRVAADGRTQVVTTTAPTVADLLAERGIALRSEDRVTVLASAPVVDGMVVGVTRMEQKTVTVVEPVPHGTTKEKTSTLYTGQTKVVTKGVNGSRRVTYTVTYANGKETGRTRVSATELEAAKDEVVQVGTKPAPTNVGGDVDSLNWAALAQCESGGNPRAVNPAGYYGLYQFSLSTWRSVGGSGNPIDASSAEQTYRAKLLYQKAGAGQWGCGSRLFS